MYETVTYSHPRHRSTRQSTLRNHNLEEQAQALFENFFFHNTINLGDTKTVFLTDIATYLNGLAMQKFPAKDKGLPVLKIKELGQR